MAMQSSSKKEELLRVAGDIFFRQGFAATGIKQIIDEAGIAKGAFYSHFNSKEEMGVAWLKSSNDKWSEAMHETMAKSKSPRTKILALFNMLEDWVKTNNYRGSSLSRKSKFP